MYVCIRINIFIFTHYLNYVYMIHLKNFRWEDIDLEPILRLEPPPTAADKAKEDEGARRLDVRFTGLVFFRKIYRKPSIFPMKYRLFLQFFPIFYDFPLNQSNVRCAIPIRWCFSHGFFRIKRWCRC